MHQHEFSCVDCRVKLFSAHALNIRYLGQYRVGDALRQRRACDQPRYAAAEGRRIQRIRSNNDVVCHKIYNALAVCRHVGQHRLIDLVVISALRADPCLDRCCVLAAQIRPANKPVKIIGRNLAQCNRHGFGGWLYIRDNFCRPVYIPDQRIPHVIFIVLTERRGNIRLCCNLMHTLRILRCIGKNHGHNALSRPAAHIFRSLAECDGNAG